MEIRTSKNKNEAVFNEGNIKIQNNTLSSQNIVLQINNISKIWVGIINNQSIPTWCIVGLISSLAFSFYAYTLYPDLIPTAIILTIAFGLVLSINLLREKVYGVLIEMNSGSIVVFSSSDNMFLHRIKENLEKVMRGQVQETITINLENKSINIGDIDGSTVNLGTIGDNSTFNVKSSIIKNRHGAYDSERTCNIENLFEYINWTILVKEVNILKTSPESAMLIIWINNLEQAILNKNKSMLYDSILIFIEQQGISGITFLKEMSVNYLEQLARRVNSVKTEEELS